MEQVSRVSESRERAVSSDLTSTRPNPFDDGTPSPRKRQRTSLSGSRSASTDTLRSQDDAAALSDPTTMRVDTPENQAPTTPDRPEPPSETVSSKVTINLRNTGSLEATPASPTSPSLAAARTHEVKASIEAADLSMARESRNDGASSPPPSDHESPDVEPIITIDDMDDDLELPSAAPQLEYLRNARLADFNRVMASFPYHTEEEPYHSTVNRFITYYRELAPNPVLPDENMQLLQTWLDRFLTLASPEFYPLVIESYQGNQAFWHSLPDLLSIVAHRFNSAKSREARDLGAHFCAQIAKVAAFLFVVDCETLRHHTVADGSEFDLVSPFFLRLLSRVMSREEAPSFNDSSPGSPPDLPDALDIFQSALNGSAAKLSRFTKGLTTHLARFPRKVLDYLSAVSPLLACIVRDGYQTHVFSAIYSPAVLERARSNLTLGMELFDTVSSALDTAVEKFITHLTPDASNQLTCSLAELYQSSLYSTSGKATDLVEKHRTEFPRVSGRLTQEVMGAEYRLRMLCRLITSRQMQLRVAAVAGLSDDLIRIWRRWQDHREFADGTVYEDYCRHFSDILLRTGIIEYILGPDCHPEISGNSNHVIGFLAVTNTYTTAQTDLLWHTITSTPDPRVSEALVRMMPRVHNLLDVGQLSYLCGKLNELPIESFTPIIRDFFGDIVHKCIGKLASLPFTAYELCVRLIRESSKYGPNSSIAYPDIASFGIAKLKDLLPSLGQGNREKLFSTCLQDVASKSKTSSGSLQVISLLMSTQVQTLPTLIEEYDLTKLLVDDLESTIEDAKAVGFSPVLAHAINYSRRKLIANIISNYGSTIESSLGRRLWELLVGEGAACQDDRKAAWDDLVAALKRARLDDNPFLKACLRDYLPALPPKFYCPNSLAFVREAIVPLTADANGIVLDDEGSLHWAGIELLWQMILTAPSQTIETYAIQTLVNDIYVDSKMILSYPLHRARKVHFSLVQRCLSQLKAAANKLKTYNDGTTSGDDEPMVIVATDNQYHEQELQFTRSLQVLITLLQTLQTRAHFSAPDLRSLMLDTPGAIEGEPAQLKYQSFDFDEQSVVTPLEIGLGNSAASLLASLREATGFENYRLYYRGQPLTPSDTSISKSLADLDIKYGLILVKKEADVAATSPVRIKPGASPLDIEILGHFKDLWGYLSMEEKLAREIYQFLISLPADDGILMAFEDPRTSHRDVFPLGQPFKSLYAVHALREFLSTRRLKNSVMRGSAARPSEQQLKSATEQEDALIKAMSLIVACICDREILEKCSGEALRLSLGLQLVDQFVQLLKETMDIESICQFLTPELLDHLLAILNDAKASGTSHASIELINRSFEALLESCAKSYEFWNVFRNRLDVRRVMMDLLLDDQRQYVRQSIAKLISTKSFYNHGPSGVTAIDFAELFWPTALHLLPRAAREPNKCEEVFGLSQQLLKKLIEGGSNVLNLPDCLKECGNLLALHSPTEDIAHPDRMDTVAYGLIAIIYYGLRYLRAKPGRIQFSPSFARKLLKQYLFSSDDKNGPLVPKVILRAGSRNMLYEIVYLLVKDDRQASAHLVRDLSSLSALKEYPDGLQEYEFELPQSFDRNTAIRSSCGYSGLKNLSNTCYLNSLFTQLFMNIRFRRFILGARVTHLGTQRLLHETQGLFASLQDSRRRFVDPQECVAQITTYDEMAIDIHNQMDVDEFYSLLFDRWEAQLSSDAEKKALRSIYGGRLVQQVKSKECEHISEREEPFSAIQCDIKGKTTLEQSLQAYVDGEIMQGDNKYNCSACNRHVDAVKRACLKDIPDNLIFHLKRFDFDLRTLQRHKINDHFAFPDKIDMRPYTIEHISNPSRDTDPDTFELVGVLVHSGTAESGHYYSFIRERPSARTSPSWVEFNDDTVSHWEPSQMENACFGGAECRTHFDAANGYETFKVYSAYMLFYQRSSSLKRDQEMLMASNHAGPVRAELPREFEIEVRSQNWSTIQRHCLYDPLHIPFVVRILSNVWGAKCSDDHQAEDMAVMVALNHLDQVASRTKDLPDFDHLKALLEKVCQRCHVCCLAFFEYFADHPDALRMLLLRNADATVRSDVGQALIFVLNHVKSASPEEYGVVNIEDVGSIGSQAMRNSVLNSAGDLFLRLWDTFHHRLIAWPEFFGTLLNFSLLGRQEKLTLLDKDFLLKLILIIMVDPALEMPEQYQALCRTISKRIFTRPPSYDGIIALIDVLLETMDPDLESGSCVERAKGRAAVATLSSEPVPFTAMEINYLHIDWHKEGNFFVDKLIRLEQNPTSTDSIIIRLMGFSAVLDHKILSTLLMGITNQIVLNHKVGPYLRVAGWYCRYNTVPDNVRALIDHVTFQSRDILHAEGPAFLEFHKEIFDAARKTGESRQSAHLQGLQNIPNWAPSLLAYAEHGVSFDVARFLSEKLFVHGVSPTGFSDSSSGMELYRAITFAARRLAISCLHYLRDTYVVRSAQASRDVVQPMSQVITQCGPYFDTTEEDFEESIQAEYHLLCQSVLEPLDRLTVDEIEEDASGM
ncbi:ubiquitin carboxyl-terminal hydrolase [Xylariomycetidae sp. FL2044]|nr:ubiquitin carboxyl-terminal hydrolase [Xylariomycetidae sp. FL2044]